jgi:positive regulator of sigma E activity
MTGTGKVTKIDGNFVTISCKPSLACHSCGSKTCSPAGRDIVARNTRGIPLKPGDYAQISLSAGHIVSSAVRVFGLPAAAFAVFYTASGSVLGEAEAARILCGLAGCALAAFWLCVWGRPKAAFPEVVRGFPPGEKNEE